MLVRTETIEVDVADALEWLVFETLDDYTEDGEDLQKLKDMMANLDESEDVQAVYTNVDNL